MRVIEIRDIVPWNVVNDLCANHWDKVRRIVMGCLDEHKEDEFNVHIEKVFKRKSRTSESKFCGKRFCDEGDVRDYILNNGDKIAKALKLKARCSYE